MSRPIIIPVQSLLCIKFLAILLVRLNIPDAFGNTTKRKLIVRFFRIAIFIRHYPVTHLMVLQIISAAYFVNSVELFNIHTVQIGTTSFVLSTQ